MRDESPLERRATSREDSITVTALRCSVQFTVCTVQYSDPYHTVKDSSVVFYFLPIRSALDSTLKNAIMYGADCYYEECCLTLRNFPSNPFFSCNEVVKHG